MNEILKRTHFLVNFKKIEVETRVLHHNGLRFLAKFQEFTHISVALYRVKYCSLFLKSSFSLGRLSFHFLYDDILLFFFVVHQIHRAKRPTSKLFFYAYISPFEKRKINRWFAFLHETRWLERSCHLRATITMQILFNVGANL